MNERKKGTDYNGKETEQRTERHNLDEGREEVETEGRTKLGGYKGRGWKARQK